MARMTRTQISLDETQYLYVKKQALLRGVSLSAVIREMIDGEMTRDAPRVADIVGIFSSGGLEGIDHDHYLYGWPKRSEESDR